MRHARIVVVAALSAVVLLPGLAGAQVGSPFDHLKCYKIKDTVANAVYQADLNPLQQPPFQLEKGCFIAARAKLFCIPVQKLNVQPPAPNAVNGIDAQDYLVYKIKCPKSEALTLPVKDQFGTRAITVGNHQLLLVPAFKESHLCHNTADPGVPPVCGGDCENPDEKCVQLPGTTQCTCEQPCGIDAAGQCGGSCPFANQVCKVVVDNTGVQECTCDPIVDGCKLIEPATGQCGGPCPSADETCVHDSTTGTCNCVRPCGPTGIRQCGGLCPTAAEACVVKADDSGCECRGTQPTPCSQIPGTAQCGGTCPNNQPCVPMGPTPGSGCVCGYMQ